MLAELVRRKARHYRETIGKRMVVFPGVKQLVPELSSRFPLAIASGALRGEIDLILQSIGLNTYFQVIISAEDVREGKPEPEIFLTALRALNQRNPGGHPILPTECLVIEDSREGVLGARRAGIKCLAVTNSHPAEELREANAVVKSLEDVTIPFLEGLVS
ncbi:MAG: HAD-IA family hydrolase [Deltaproteobacteria bacterium]|nr:HAD-IA family hydrolase [Deltaproteobacteria bacterium]